MVYGGNEYCQKSRVQGGAVSRDKMSLRDSAR